MKKVKYNGEEIYIDEKPLDERENDRRIYRKEELEKTLAIDKSLIENILNKWSDKNE